MPCGDLREPRVEIAERRTQRVIVEAAFHRQQRRPPLDDDEVDLSSVGIAKVPEIQLTTLRVLLEVHPLQQVGGDERPFRKFRQRRYLCSSSKTQRSDSGRRRLALTDVFSSIENHLQTFLV